MKGTLLIFVKAPVAGCVKTRLARELGFARAAALFRIMTKKTIAEARRGGWRTVLAVDPCHALVGYNTVWPNDAPRVFQGGGDLGDRMGRIFQQTSYRANVQKKRAPVVVIGADAPKMQTRHIMRAFKALQGHDAVFGPTSDGGYWLIGLAGRRGAPDLFNNVRWSTSHALEDTKASLPADFRIAEIDRLDDVDDASDLRRVGPNALHRSWKTG